MSGIYDRGDHPAGPVSMVIPLTAAQELIGVEGQINEVLVSNRGDAIAGAQHSDEVVALIEPLVGGTGLEVTAVKQEVLDDADAAGASFSTIFLLFAQFSVAAGVLLIFLIFVMLAAERKHELGIARAVGAQRAHVIRLFTFEGALYAVMAAAIGSVLGVAVGYGMVFILKAAFDQLAEAQGTLELAFSFSWKSVVLAFTMGMVLTFIVVVVSSWRVSRLNIVRAVRDIPEPTVQRRTWRGLALAVLLPILGVFMAARRAPERAAGPVHAGHVAGDHRPTPARPPLRAARIASPSRWPERGCWRGGSCRRACSTNAFPRWSRAWRCSSSRGSCWSSAGCGWWSTTATSCSP